MLPKYHMNKNTVWIRWGKGPNIRSIEHLEQNRINYLINIGKTDQQQHQCKTLLTECGTRINDNGKIRGRDENTYHWVMGTCYILQQGRSCLRTDGIQNCTHLFPNSSFHASAPAGLPHAFCGTQKLSGVHRSAQTRRVHINSHAYTCIHHQIQLAVGDTTMSGWKPTISLIHPPMHFV